MHTKPGIQARFTKKTTASLTNLPLTLVVLVVMLCSYCGTGNERNAPVRSDGTSTADDSTEVREIILKDLRIPATDSGAAATAMSTGRKTGTGRISWGADSLDGPRRNLGDQLSSEGWSVAVVSTVPFSHATPASFVAHNPYRYHYYTGRGRYAGRGISEEMLFAGPANLIIGAGHPEWDNPTWQSTDGYISRESFTALRNGVPGLIFVERSKGLDGADLLADACTGDPDDGERIVGLFGGTNGCFDPPVPTDDGSGAVIPVTEENPTLAEAAAVALEYLVRDDQGFFLVLEQGDIDWANHDNDYGWMIGAMWDLENAAITVIEFVDSNPLLDWEDTMIILTSDHSNGYMRLDPASPPMMGELPEQRIEAGNYIYPDGKVTYSSTGHSNELVSFYARFPDRVASLLDSLEGAPPAAGGEILDNTHIHHIIDHASRMEEPVTHIILIIGDGMDPEHERAAGLYLHGSDRGIAWQDSVLFPYSTWCTTWNVNTYDLYAAAAGVEPFNDGSYDPAVGYDPVRGGLVPGAGDPEYFLTPLPAPAN